MELNYDCLCNYCKVTICSGNQDHFGNGVVKPALQWHKPSTGLTGEWLVVVQWEVRPTRTDMAAALACKIQPLV
jgi:hypothetical protein